MYFGGNSEMRGYQYLEFLGQRAFFLNAELRFPLVEAMLTPIGVLGGIRGVFFANLGGANFEGQSFTLLSRESEMHTPVTFDSVTLAPIQSTPRNISGLRLVDGRASYGIGLETFLLGYPVHFDWAWKTLFNKDWEDVIFAGTGGSQTFRKPKFSVWIGYDF
jgi:outer membrane protein assembly factor BamA